MEFLIGLVIITLLGSNLVLVRWIITHSSSFRAPKVEKVEKPKATFGGVPFGVRK